MNLSMYIINNAANGVDATTSDRAMLRVLQIAGDLPTPCLLIDGIVVERNIERMARYCQMYSLGLRPHTKTHKSRRIARLQLDAGAIGLTVAKPGEAMVMAEIGSPLLIAYPPITRSSRRAVEQIIESCEVIVALDSIEAIETLESVTLPRSKRVGVLVDVDVGLHRTGVNTPDESVRIAKRIAASDRLRYDGLLCYPGHIWSQGEKQASEIVGAGNVIQRHVDELVSQGLAPAIVSAGSTPTAFQTHLARAVTEIRPGTYVFNDLNTLRGGFCDPGDCAVRILATVVSTAVPGQVVIDAGTKALSSDRCISDPTSGHGLVVEYPQAMITLLSEEHGQIDVTRCDRRPMIGERVSIIPNHVCPTINLTDVAWWMAADGSLEQLPIDARGMVR